MGFTSFYIIPNFIPCLAGGTLGVNAVVEVVIDLFASLVES